jgi:hypothetical protein
LLLEDRTLRAFPAQPINENEPGVRIQLQLLTDVAWLLAQPIAKAPLLSLRRRALSLALRSGVLQRYPNGRLKVGDLVHSAEEMLLGSDRSGGDTVSPGVSLESNKTWWRRVIAGKRDLGDPLPWLIMIRAAGSSVETLLRPYSDARADARSD